MKAPTITRAGKQYVSQPATDGCAGCVASGATKLCQALPSCHSRIFVEHKDEIKMNKPHKHAEIAIAWLQDQSIKLEFKRPLPGAVWEPRDGSMNPTTNVDYEWRIKPEPKPDVVGYADIDSFYCSTQLAQHNLKLTFDGETGKLKSAEVIS